MVSPWCSASAVPETSNGLTPSAPSPPSSSSSQAPASRESTTTPSLRLRSGPSLATRFSPSRTGLTNRTSDKRQRGQRTRPVVRLRQHDRRPVLGRPERVVDPLGRVLHVGRVGEILGEPLPRRIGEGQVDHLAAPLGALGQQLLEGEHPPHNVLRGLHAIRPGDDAALTQLGAQRVGRRGARWRRRLFGEHVGVGAERGHERARRRPAGGGVAPEEAGLPLVAVEAAGAVAGHAVEQLGRHVVGQHLEDGRRSERRVQEVHGAQVGPALGEHPTEQREVIVLHRHDVAFVGPRHDGVGHGAVVGPVALPRDPPVAVEARPVRQIEEMVVDVPQRRVGHDVVGLAVRVVVDLDGDEVEPVEVHEPPGHGLAVRRPHRHRGPRGAGPRQQAVDRGGQSAAGRDRNELAVAPGAERQRPPVGDDDSAAHARRGSEEGDVRASAARKTSTAWGRSSCRGRLRWIRSPRSTCARRSAPSSFAASISSPSSTP